MLLYPEGWTSDELTYEASLEVADRMEIRHLASRSGETGDDLKGQRQITFKPVSLTMLIDGPVITGQYLKVVPLNPGQTPPVEMDVAADSGAALDAPADVWEHYKNLVTQAERFLERSITATIIFSSVSATTWRTSGWSITNRMTADWGARPCRSQMRASGSGLLSHEYVHSWNGKYRRPADLATPDYEKPMQTDLLWVYEGLTTYLGEILTGRDGERTPEQFRDALAYTAAVLDHRPGRTWRNLQDTADGVPAMQDAPHQWESWRRPLDYYEEDELNWLWADTIIRQQTHGQKTLDDFCRLFHGAPSGPPQVKTYTFEDVVSTLNQVAAYDWRGFWIERLGNHGPGAPLGGIEGSGWKLVYDDARSELVRAREDDRNTVNAAYSIGLWLKREGVVTIPSKACRRRKRESDQA